MLCKLIALVILITPLVATSGSLTLTDDTGRDLYLVKPAERIVSLAPHVTEVLFAAGAGEQVVGVVAYSDYPEAARSLPQVGGHSNVDLEAIVALRPDLVIAWAGGNREAHLDKLGAMGIPVYLDESRNLEGVAHSIEQFGLLAGTHDVARRVADDFRTRWRRLAEDHAGRPPVPMFYQIWNEPLITINGQHLISDVIRLCGGQNVFSDLEPLAPRIGTEAVLARAPEVIIASGMGEARPEWLDAWHKWPDLPAAKMGNLYYIPPDILQRHTPRILDGAERLCAYLEEARDKRSPR